MFRFLLRTGWRPDEVRLVALMFAHSFLFGFAFTLYEAIADALFLIHYGARLLPYAYLAATAGTALAAFAYSRLEERMRPAALFTGVVATILVILLAVRGGFWFVDAKSMSLVLRVAGGPINLLMELEFWSLAGTQFTLRQGKKIFPLIGAGEVLAGVVGGLTVTALSGVIALHDLLFFSAGSTLVCLFLLRRIQRSSRVADVGDEHELRPEGFRIRTLFGSNYRLLILYVFALFTFGFYLVDFAFYQQLDARFGRDEAELAGFLGGFTAISSGVQLLTQVLLSGWLLTRYGIRVGLLALPVTMGLAVGAILIVGRLDSATATLFWIVIAAKLFETVLNDGLYDPAFRILYQPLPAASRMGLQAFVEGLFGAFVAGLAGLFLLALTEERAITAVDVAVVLGVVLLAWIPITYALCRAYGRVLQESLAKRSLSADCLTLDDGSSREILERWLASPDEVEVSYALHVLGDDVDAGLEDRYVALLNHQSSRVRRAVLERIERGRVAGATDAVARLVEHDPTPDVRSAALQTLVAIGEASGLDRALPYVSDSRPELQKGALVGLLRHGGIEGVLAAGTELMDRSRSMVVADRLLAADVLGAVATPAFYRPLLPLLADVDPGVRAAALKAAATVAHPALCPALLLHLDSASERSLAVAALAAVGAPAVGALDAALSRVEVSLHERLLYVRTLRRIHCDAAVAALKSRTDDPDAPIRREALAGLSSLKYLASDSERSEWMAGISRECERTVGLLGAAEDVADVDVGLDRALAIEVKRQVDLILLRLSLVIPSPGLQDTRTHLDGDSPEKRALAVEILEHLLPKDLRDRILPLVEDLPRTARLKRLQSFYPHKLVGREERLRQILDGGSDRAAWTRAFTLYHVGLAERSDCRPSVERNLNHAEPMLHETAAWAIDRLAGGPPCS